MTARRRSPTGARPRTGAILVEGTVSSMKTSGAGSGYAANQASRRDYVRTSCCAAWAAYIFSVIRRRSKNRYSVLIAVYAL